MKISIFLVVLLAVATASASVQKRSTSYASTINNFVDRTISLVQSYLVANELDSISVPNVTQSFSYKPLWVTYSGRLSLYNGVMSELSTIKRFGDVVLSYDTGVLAVEFDMGVDQLSYTFDFQAKLLGISYSGYVTGTLKTIDVVGGIAMDLTSYQLTLNSFEIAEVGSVSAKIHGSNSITDYITNIFVSLTISIVQNTVVGDVNELITAALQDTLVEINASLGPSSG